MYKSNNIASIELNKTESKTNDEIKITIVME